MPVTKYGDQKVIYVNFGNQAQSKRISILKGNEERENRKGNQLYYDQIAETRHRIDEGLSVLSGTIQFMERAPKKCSEMESDDVLRTERIYRCGKALLNDIQNYIYLVDERND